MKKPSGTMVFAGIVALVVGYAVYDYKSSEKETETKEKQSLVLQTMADQIKTITFQKGSDLIELQRDKEGWKLVKPVQDLANSNVVNQFLEGLATEKTQDTVIDKTTSGDKVDFSTFGLDQPMGVITVTGNSEERTRFSIGNRKNFQGDAYLRKNEEQKVSTVSSTWFDKINKTALDFRDKRLMRISNAPSEKIEIEQGADKFQLVKKDSNWVIQSQPTWKLDQNKVRELLSMLNTTEALEFIAEGNASPKELKNWGLNKPRTKLTVFLKDNQQWSASLNEGYDHVHRIQTSDPQLVLKISPTDSDKFAQMGRDHFRDRNEPFDFDKTRVQTLEILQAGKKAELNADSDAAKALLTRLKTFKIAQFEAKPRGQLDNEIVMKDKQGETVFRFQWGQVHRPDGREQAMPEFNARTSVVGKEFSVLEADINNLKLEEGLPEDSTKGSTK